MKGAKGAKGGKGANVMTEPYLSWQEYVAILERDSWFVEDININSYHSFAGAPGGQYGLGFMVC